MNDRRPTSQEVTIVVLGASSDTIDALARCLSETFKYRLILITRVPDGERPPWLRHEDHWLSGYDLAQDEDIERLQPRLPVLFTTKQIVVLCATGKFVGFAAMMDHSVEQFRQLIESNLLAVHGAARCLLPIMIERGGGHFITLGSHAADMAYPRLVPFSVAKMGLQSFIKGLSNEYLKYGITCANLALATVDTPEERDLRPFANHDDWLRIDEVACAVDAIIQGPVFLHNGNTMHVFKYSDVYFQQSWFDRIGLGRPEE